MENNNLKIWVLLAIILQEILQYGLTSTLISPQPKSWYKWILIYICYITEPLHKKIMNIGSMRICWYNCRFLIVFRKVLTLHVPIRTEFFTFSKDTTMKLDWVLRSHWYLGFQLLLSSGIVCFLLLWIGYVSQ